MTENLHDPQAARATRATALAGLACLAALAALTVAGCSSSAGSTAVRAPSVPTVTVTSAPAASTAPSAPTVTVGCYGQEFGPAPQQTLGYGQSLSFGTITCVSEYTGMTCTDSSTGRYFRVSRDTYELG